MQTDGKTSSSLWYIFECERASESNFHLPWQAISCLSWESSRLITSIASGMINAHRKDKRGACQRFVSLQVLHLNGISLFWTFTFLLFNCERYGIVHPIFRSSEMLSRKTLIAVGFSLLLCLFRFRLKFAWGFIHQSWLKGHQLP